MSTAPSFRKGAEAAKEAAARNNLSFARTHFFGLKDKERAAVRFLLDVDEWITVDQHAFVPTRPAPPNFEGNWPQNSTAVCRNDVAFNGAFPDCFICAHVPNKKGKPSRPSSRVWGLAVLREEVMENGRIVGYRDGVRKVAEMKDGQPTGNEIEEKAVVIVNMPYKTFFSALEGFGSIYGTILDRDYYVTRNGAELDTDYQIVPLDPIVMGDGRRFDLREPDLLKRYAPLPNIEEIVAHRASDDYYARFFDVRVPQPDSGFSSNSTGAAVADTANEPPADLLAHYANRATAYGAGQPVPDAPAPEATQPAPPQQPAAQPGQMRSFD